MDQHQAPAYPQIPEPPRTPTHPLPEPTAKTTDSEQPLSHTALAVLFLVIVPLVAHFLYSRLGFNPTDDGFILAYSRRLLMGQIPHRDFIAIRPVGSAVLHAPFVLFGFGYTFWLSRLFVWFELAAIGWAWVSITEKMLKISLRNAEKVLLALIAFILSAHTFPVMAWHTIDGLFLSAVGLALCLRKPGTLKLPAVLRELGIFKGLRAQDYTIDAKLVGYVLIGLAYLAKQNFLPVAVVSILALRDWRDKRYWLALAAPGATYVGYLLLAGALPDAISQLRSQTGFMEVAVNRYTGDAGLKGQAVWAFLVMFLAYVGIRSRTFWRRAIGLVAAVFLFRAVYDVAIALRLGDMYSYAGAPSFGLLAITAGAGLSFLTQERKTRFLRLGILVVVAGWATSVSIGYANPALATGPLAVVLLGFVYGVSLSRDKEDWMRDLCTLLTVGIAVVAIIGFRGAREQFIYRERPAKDLTQSLSGVFPGGNLILTNQNTYNFLADLNEAVKKTNGKTYAIVPDMAAYWVKAPQANPLPIDWPQGTELATPALVDRVTGTLKSRKGKIVVIVQKVLADVLPNGFTPLSESGYAVVQFVHANMEQVGETEYFELYE